MRCKLALSILCFLILLLSQSSIVFSQTNRSDWVKIYGESTDEYPNDIVRARDGGYLVLGSKTETTQFGPTDLCWLVKIDCFGNIEWNRTFTQEASLAYGQSLSEINGEYFIAGDTLDPFSGWLAKLDSSGNLIFSKRYAGVGQIQAIAPFNDDGYVLLTSPSNQSSLDAVVVKIDMQGNVEWKKTYGGSQTDVFGHVFRVSDQNYLFAGSTVSFGAGGTDFWLVCTDSKGNELWSKTYGFSSYDTLQGMLQTVGGDYVMAGATMSNNGGILIMRIDASGTMKWNKTYGISGVPWDILETSDGGFITTGNDGVLKVDLLGNLQWVKGFEAEIRYMTRASDGGYILAGCLPREGFNRNIWLAKIDGLGEILTNPIGSALNINGSSFSVPQPLDAAKMNNETGIADVVTLSITGNISAPQISSITVSENQTEGTAAISMVVTGDSGTAGFGNMTVSKSLIADNFVPAVYIDSQKVSDQGFAQDAENYYVWFSTHFSTHEVLIDFNLQQQSSSSGSSGIFLALGVGVFVVVVLIIVCLFVIKRRRKPS